MKSLNEILRAAEEQGCRVEKTRSSHYKIYPPRGEIIVVASTPSDWRAIRNIISRLRHAGIVVGGR